MEDTEDIFELIERVEPYIMNTYDLLRNRFEEIKTFAPSVTSKDALGKSSFLLSQNKKEVAKRNQALEQIIQDDIYYIVYTGVPYNDMAKEHPDKYRSIIASTKFKQYFN